MSDQPRELLDVALEAAHHAGEILVARSRRAAEGVSTKSTPTDLVSDADRAAEQLLLTLLEKRRPQDGVIGEEGADRPSTSGLNWVVDPLDGTVNFLFEIPHWCVSVAVEDTDGGVAGVIHDPLRDETFAATRAGGATLNGTSIRVSDATELSQSLIGTGFYYDADVRRRQGQTVARILPLVRDVRRGGSAALDLAYLACGRLDGFYEAPTEHWDRAAGELIIREAGGIVTDLPAPNGLSTGVIASGPRLHQALVDLVTDATP